MFSTLWPLFLGVDLNVAIESITDPGIVRVQMLAITSEAAIQSSLEDSRLALPPTAAVLIVTVLSLTNLSR